LDDEDTWDPTADRQALVDLTFAYSYALDDRRFDDLDDVFLSDATAELDWLLEASDAIKGRVRDALLPLDTSQHLVANHHVVVDGDRASGRCSLYAQRPNGRRGRAPLHRRPTLRGPLRVDRRRLAHRPPRADRALDRRKSRSPQPVKEDAMDGDYEDVTMYTLDADVEEQLLLGHNECTFIWSNKEGWPVGVIMSYVWRKGRFWLTASGQRARVAAVRRDPRVCVVVTSTGSALPRNKAVTWKGTCMIHDRPEVKDWFYEELARALNPDDARRAAQFESFLDSPRRVVLEVTPTQRIGYDGAKMRAATDTFLGDR